MKRWSNCFLWPSRAVSRSLMGADNSLADQQSLSTNHQVESAALAYVMQYERAAGRSPRDTRYSSGAGADIDSPPRLIEVKAFGKSARGGFLWMETRQFEEARRNSNFYVYVVENVRQGNPSLFTLRVLDNIHLVRLLEKA